ncbi:TPA: hypothetical protein ACWWUK_004141 [Citrobacter youngae]
MSTISREWLQSQISAIKAVGITDSNTLQAFEIALASLEAEPVAWLWSHRKHPSEVSLVRPEDDERAEGAHWSGWNCQALYAAPPAPASVPDEDLLHMAASAIEDLLSNKDRYCAGVWADIPAKLRRAAMLQGARNHPEDNLDMVDHSGDSNNMVEPVTTACKLRDAVDTIRNSGIAIDGEKILAERDALNSPVIPDGWVAVPVEPTIAILDEFDSIIDYGAEDSKDAWSRLLAAAWIKSLPAAPQLEVK